MAGYFRLYCVGDVREREPFRGVDSVHFLILVRGQQRQQFDVHYFDRSIIQLGAVRTVIPAAPQEQQALLDACIAFYPAYFKDCPSLLAAGRRLRRVSVLDFSQGGEPPKEWLQLRQEAWPAFQKLTITEADLRPTWAGDRSQEPSLLGSLLSGWPFRKAGRPGEASPRPRAA